MRTFSLYPEEQRWWSFNDYGAVVDVMGMTGAKRVLEFGPGSSTLALIEGGATEVDSCEDDPHWAELYDRRFRNRFPGVVEIVPYEWSNPLRFDPALTSKRYDLALVDGPRETERRPAVVLFCLERCEWVLVPTESNEGSTLMFSAAVFAAQVAERPLQILTTGPLAGSFALIGPPC